MSTPEFPRAPVRVVTGLQYGEAGGFPLLVDLAYPDPLPEAPCPAVIHIHGGGWYEGERGVSVNSLLPNHGFVYASVDYRLSGQALFPAQLHDVKAAVRWLRAHAAEHHVDPYRIGVRGDSAGAHLAALLGVTGDWPELEGASGWAGHSSQVGAVAGVAPPTDLLDPDWPWQRRPGNPSERLLGGSPWTRPDLARQADPVAYLDRPAPPGGWPPFLLVHGELDPWVPVGHSRRLHEALTAAGAESTFIPVPGGDHGLQDRWPEVMGWHLEFFRRHLGEGRA